MNGFVGTIGPIQAVEHLEIAFARDAVNQDEVCFNKGLFWHVGNNEVHARYKPLSFDTNTIIFSSTRPHVVSSSLNSSLRKQH